MRQLIGAHAAQGRSPFPPIAEYAFLSDCEATALVAPSGNVEWMCLPRMDSPSVFGAILDREAGLFRLGPADVSVPDRAALPARARWCSRRAGAPAAAGSSCATACWSARGATTRSAPTPTAARPTDYDAEHIFLRTIRCVNGSVQITLDCEPAFDYGRHALRLGLRRRGLPRGRGHRRRASTTRSGWSRTSTSASRGRARPAAT